MDTLWIRFGYEIVFWIRFGYVLDTFWIRVRRPGTFLDTRQIAQILDTQAPKCVRGAQNVILDTLWIRAHLCSISKNFGYVF